jgi:hypothetical protein
VSDYAEIERNLGRMAAPVLALTRLVALCKEAGLPAPDRLETAWPSGDHVATWFVPPSVIVDVFQASASKDGSFRWEGFRAGWLTGSYSPSGQSADATFAAVAGWHRGEKP